jgi:hypothetical protein
MNATDRLWRALAAGEWASMRAQLSHRASIERVGEGDVPADEYVAHHRAAGVPDSVEIRRSTGDGTIVAVEAAVQRGGGRWRVLAMYDLHNGRIAHGVEAWLPEA